MKETITKVIVKCDFCSTVMQGNVNEFGEVLGKDVCNTCLIKLHDEVEKEYHRVIKGEVPCRRGGYRKLGMPSDT